MKSSFKIIYQLDQFLNPLETLWLVSGGWAIDLHLNRITRNRCDLDISVPYSNRLLTLGHFLQEGWQIEGKLMGGFKTIRTISDFEDEIRYFWSFPPGVEFIGEHIDERGNRRISYKREVQFELDYLEVFFDKIVGEQFIYQRDHRVKRNLNQAVLIREDVKYLAPEIVLLFKSNDLSEKNHQDFISVVEELDNEQKAWLTHALRTVNNKPHPWLERLKL